MTILFIPTTWRCNCVHRYGIVMTSLHSMHMDDLTQVLLPCLSATNTRTFSNHDRGMARNVRLTARPCLWSIIEVWQSRSRTPEISTEAKWHQQCNCFLCPQGASKLSAHLFLHKLGAVAMPLNCEFFCYFSHWSMKTAKSMIFIQLPPYPSVTGNCFPQFVFPTSSRNSMFCYTYIVC